MADKDADSDNDPAPSLDIGWQPATSQPGEMYTPEGRIRAAGVAAAGLVDRDPRRRAYKRQMVRTGLLVAAAGAVIAVVIGIVAAAVG